MSRLLTRRPGGANRKAALRPASTPPSPLRRCAASSLTTPPHLRFVEVVRERGRRGAQGAWVMNGRQRQLVVNGGRQEAAGGRDGVGRSRRRSGSLRGGRGGGGRG